MMTKVNAWVLASLLLPACASEEPLESEVQAAGNSDAVICCKDLFPPGKDRGQCIAQAAKGLGPCVIDAGVPDEVPDAAVVVDAEVPVEVIDAEVVPVP